MIKAKNCSIGSDEKLTTLETADDLGKIEATKADAPPSEEEIEEDTIIVNPDPESMNSRG